MADITISAAGLRIMKLLVGRPPQSISCLAYEIGVTRTAVSEKLDELMASGFVEQTLEKLSGRGRPRHVYKATGAAMRNLFENKQCSMVPAIWKAIRDEAGEQMMEKILRRVSFTLIDHYCSLITAHRPRERLQQALEVLSNEGCLLEALETDGLTVIYRRSCPFFSMADEQRSVCRVDQAVLSKLIGRPIRKRACRHEGAPCCEFEIMEEKA